MSFGGASVLVTGGSRGIGREIALRFADEGAKRVAIGYMRNDTAAEAVAAELRERGADVVLVRGNVSSTRVADEVAALGALDVLVHSAATGVARPALETEDKHWDWTLAANARALLSLTRAAAPSMPQGSAIVGDLEPRLVARARELRARRRVEGGARVGRALPRRRARAARHPRQRRLRRRRRDRRARRVPEQGADARARRASARRRDGWSRRATSPTPSSSSAARLADDLRADDHRRRRLLAASSDGAHGQEQEGVGRGPSPPRASRCRVSSGCRRSFAARSATSTAGASCICSARRASRRRISPSSARSSPASTSRARRSTSRASAGPTSPGCRPTSTTCPPS